jgi:hypothetical protein
MPDTRTHRGPHPEDRQLFGPPAIPRLRAAVADLSLLLTKGYAEKSSLKLVGDHFDLTHRQRLAVMRNACSDQQLESRLSRRVELTDAAGRSIMIDGYNLLITTEAAISGGFIFEGRDHTYKDLASIHGTYRKVTETIPAIMLIGGFLAENNIQQAHWLLDSPVSNSGRLKTLINQIAQENNWSWEVSLLTNPDTELMKTDLIVASSDGVVLDGCGKWLNLAAEIITRRLPDVRLIGLSTAD